MTLIDADTAIARCTRLHHYFDQLYAEACNEWLPEDPPITVLFGNFGAGLGEIWSSLSASERRSVWDLIEQLLLDGTKDVGDAIATGFIEAVINQVDQGKINFGDLLGYIGAETLAYWKAWDEFTGVHTRGLPE